MDIWLWKAFQYLTMDVGVSLLECDHRRWKHSLGPGNIPLLLAHVLWEHFTPHHFILNDTPGGGRW